MENVVLTRRKRETEKYGQRPGMSSTGGSFLERNDPIRSHLESSLVIKLAFALSFKINNKASLDAIEFFCILVSSSFLHYYLKKMINRIEIGLSQAVLKILS